MGNNKLIRKTMTMLLAFVLAFTMMPFLGSELSLTDDSRAYAAASAPGGDVCIGSNIGIDTIKAAFGNAVGAEYSDGSEEVLRITLNSDINLSNPLNLYRASTSEKNCRMIIDLNGHNITGADSKDAIRLYSVLRFYVEIAGPGTVKGGTGAVCTESNYRYGGEGGYGINVIAARSDYKEYDFLKCGLTIKGGANVEGGPGASLAYDDWLYNLNKASDDDKLKCYAGDGGCGIGSDARDGNNFIRYDIQNGTVKGGEGGSVNIGDNIINFNSMMKIAKFKEYYSGRTYGCGLPSFVQGNGGDGLRFYGGRTYINISAQGSIIGGDGGAVSQEDTAVQVSDVMQGSTGDGGDGIDLYGNACLGGTSPSYTSAGWQNASGSISSDSQYMGLYIAGTVKGGSTKNVILKSQSGLNGGNGISLHPYTGAVRGIIAIDNSGIVSGGDGGNGLRGSAGTGGNGIKEDGSEQVNRFGKYYLINGTVAGGSGGDSWASIGNAESIGSNGGHGFNMNIRADDANDEVGVRTIAGTGSISGGASGSVLADSSVAERNGQEAMYYGSSWGYVDQVVKVSQNVKINKGTAPTVINNSTYSKGISAKASISDRNLKCEVTAPNFSGKKFISWTVATYQQSGEPNNGWPIETGTSNYSNFMLLNNSDYQNCLKNSTDVATVERIAEDLHYNRTSAKIFCTVVLEDGRYVKCEPIELPALWNGEGNYSGGESGGGDQPSQDEIDRQAAAEVENMMRMLPWSTSDSILDHKADVEACRSAYNLLTDAQKKLILAGVYQEFLKCEARFEEQQSDAEAVAEVKKLIDALDADQITDVETAQQADNNLKNIRQEITGLTAAQQQMLAEDTDAVAKLQAVEEAIASQLGEDHNHVHMMVHVERKEATCTNAGHEKHYQCLTDGKKYSDIEGQSEVSDDDIEIPVDETKHVMKTVEAQAATCTHGGNKKYYICGECGTMFEDAAGNIEFTDIESVKTDINPSAHSFRAVNSWNSYDIDFYRSFRTDKCSNCGHTKQVTVRTVYYRKSLPKLKVAKGKAAKKKFTAKWKKVSKKNKKKIGGIEIQVQGPGLNKVYTAGKGKSSKSIKVPQAKKKYKYRVRAYKGSGTGKQVSKWSGWKTVKVK